MALDAAACPPARLRYSCLLTVTDDPIPARAYLRALVATGLGVRMLSILGGPIDPELLLPSRKQLVAEASGSKPWLPHASLFTSPVADRYVNLVAAPPGLMLGTAVRASQVAPKIPTVLGGDVGIPSFRRSELVEDRAPGQAMDEVVYTPTTALAGRFTVGVPNVAITCAPPGGAELSEHERHALSLYDVVITHTQDHAVALERAGIACALTPPDKDDAARTLRILFEQLLEPSSTTPPLDGFGGFPNF